MTHDKTIFIKNIYYMLAYAFEALKQPSHEEIEAEDFDNVMDLFAAILAKGIAQQLKRGLYREYIPESGSMAALRGKLDMQGTMKHKLARRQLLTCEFDEFSENNILNRILKTTAYLLINQSSVKAEHHDALKTCLLYFSQVDLINPSLIQWRHVQFHKNNRSYALLLNICYFALHSLLLTTEKGVYKMTSFLDPDHMNLLYERFVREYYRYHHPELNARAQQIPWATDDGFEDFLPSMKTDTTLKRGNKTLIIDTKYYARTMQERSQYNSRTLHSQNLYQIFTYVKNLAAETQREVSGLLLLPKPMRKLHQMLTSK